MKTLLSVLLVLLFSPVAEASNDFIMSSSVCKIVAAGARPSTVVSNTATPVTVFCGATANKVMDCSYYHKSIKALKKSDKPDDVQTLNLVFFASNIYVYRTLNLSITFILYPSGVFSMTTLYFGPGLGYAATKVCSGFWVSKKAISKKPKGTAI